MTLVLLESSHLKPALNEFSKLLSSLVGPCGYNCLINFPVDSLTLTSSSSRVASNLPISSPLLQFAVQCIKSQTERCGDGGLYCGIFLCKLMTYLIDCPFPQQIACCILLELGCLIQTHLHTSEQLRLRVTLDSIQPFIAVARSVIFSKIRKYDGAGSAINAQVALLVRSFLLSEACVEKVLLCVREKVEKQGLFHGVLYLCSDEEHFVLQNKEWSSVSVLVFTVMLTDRMDCKEKDMPGVEYSQKGKDQLQAAEIFINEAVSCGIQVIACQKVVHPSLILKLKRKGVLILQRLGKRMTEAVEMLSGAVSISSLNISDLDSLTQLKGHLRRVQHVQECGEDFVLLEGKVDSGICSLLFSSRSLESSEELKVVANQALGALSQVLHDSVVCPGGGCTEMYLSYFLQKEVHKRREDLCIKLKCSSAQLNSVMKWLQEGLFFSIWLEFQDWRTGCRFHFSPCLESIRQKEFSRR